MRGWISKDAALKGSQSFQKTIEWLRNFFKQLFTKANNFPNKYQRSSALICGKVCFCCDLSLVARCLSPCFPPCLCVSAVDVRSIPVIMAIMAILAI
jgi:hypothetical protein